MGCRRCDSTTTATRVERLCSDCRRKEREKKRAREERLAQRWRESIDAAGSSAWLNFHAGLGG